jgi:murein DD-endopeptidase MepM/ murein hydrolase activator NlpD
MTRRERIAAERLAAGLAPRATAAMPERVDGVPVSPDVAVSAPVAVSPGVAASVDAEVSRFLDSDAARLDAPAAAAPTSPDVAVAMPPQHSSDVFDAPAPASPDVVAAAPSVAVPTVSPSVEAEPVVSGSPASERVASAPVAAQSPAARRRTERTVRRVQRTADRSAAVAARPARSGASFRRRASAFSGGAVLVVVAGLIVGTSVPAQAFYTPNQSPNLRVAAAAVDDQSLQVGSAGTDGDVAATRDGYSVTDVVVAPQNTSGTFTNDPNGSIQWPFPVGVPISSGFGGRNVAGCSFCSTFHEGADFAPGAGTPIGAVAAGTVIKVKADDGGYGNDVWVQHDIDGKEFVSVYGHMKDGSFKVVQGQTVTVGQELGEVGSTGNSTGPHLHLEIHVNDVPVDPIAWLKANAN